jgi:hypothetical protein
MEIDHLRELATGTPVWIWIVRMAEGKWLPGAVQRITVREDVSTIVTRFECRSAKTGSRANKHSFVGMSTTPMRYLEFRDPDLKGDDRPNFVPVSISATPEGKNLMPGKVKHSPTLLRAPKHADSQ